MCLNTEWGGLGNAGELDKFLTKYDDELDKESGQRRGKQRFEKAISGLYLVRLPNISKY